MKGMVFQIERTISGSIPDAGNIVFNSVVKSSENIDYDGMSGVVTLGAPGTYDFSWWVAINPLSEDIVPVFKLLSSKGDSIKGMPDAQGKISGTGSVTVTNTRVTVRITNISAKELAYSDASAVKAGLTISMEGQGPAVQIPEPADLKEDRTRVKVSAVPQVVPGNASSGYSLSQLYYVLGQLIQMYTGTWTVYTNSLYALSGKPIQLFASPLGAGESLLVLQGDGEYKNIPLCSITAVSVGDNAVYSPSIAYLPPSALLPAGLDPNLVTAVQSRLPLNTEVEQMLLGATVQVSGLVYKNECGLLVLSDAQGNKPVFIPDCSIVYFTTATDQTLDAAGAALDRKQWKQMQRSLKKTKVSISNQLPGK